MPKVLRRAARRLTPIRWLERMQLACHGIVLMFHEVHDDSVGGLKTGTSVAFLEWVIRELRNEGWDIVTLDDAIRRLRHGDRSRRFAVLTFDDGYRDVMMRALPVLEQHDAPFAVFVPTGAPTRDLHSWWLGVRALFERRDEVTIPAMRMRFRCGDPESKMRAYQEVNSWVHQDYRRAPMLTETFRECGISLSDLNDIFFMNEAELRVLAGHRLTTVGAHTTSHGALSIVDTDCARREMCDNRAYIERLIDRPVTHLAYPYGTRAACGPREFHLAAEAGFRTAVTAQYGPVFSVHYRHPHAIPRVAAPRAGDTSGFASVIRELRNATRHPFSVLSQ